jgi:transaldolase
MEYLVDTAHLDDIKRFCAFLPISGVTSNPSIVKKEGKIDFFAHMKKIRSVIGPQASFHIQVSATDYDGMMKDAHAILEKVDDQVAIKVPVTMEGIKTIKALKAEGANVTATAVYSKAQAFMALEAGADYIAPYYNRMEAMGIDSAGVIADIATIINTYGYKTKILAASFKNVAQIDKAILAGAQCITSAPEIYETALSGKVVAGAVDDFTRDWQAVYGDDRICDLR